MTGATGLIRYDEMCRAIAEAYEVDEVKDIRDRAIALEHYSRLAHNVQAERKCCEIRLRAERKAGELLRAMEKAKPENAVQRSRGTTDARTLSDLGITKDQSSNWQRLADVPEDAFEAGLAGSDKPTTAGLLRATEKPAVTPVSSEALWLWGRLRDFERDRLLDMTAEEVLATMTAGMLADVLRLAPHVAAWLCTLNKEEI